MLHFLLPSTPIEVLEFDGDAGDRARRQLVAEQGALPVYRDHPRTKIAPAALAGVFLRQPGIGAGGGPCLPGAGVSERDVRDGAKKQVAKAVQEDAPGC
jgi:hypothetical protein